MRPMPLEIVETAALVAMAVRLRRIAGIEAGEPSGVMGLQSQRAVVLALGQYQQLIRQGSGRRQLARGLSLLSAKGVNSAEAVEAYTRARDLCEKSGDADRLFVALWNLCITTALRDIA